MLCDNREECVTDGEKNQNISHNLLFKNITDVKGSLSSIFLLIFTAFMTAVIGVFES